MKTNFGLRLRSFFPFLQWWPRVNTAGTRAELMAGLTGAIILLP
jgi:SulP family sulfate permease